jgi:ABC-type amino acid transport system permease subunit
MWHELEFVIDHLPELLVGFPGHRPGGLLMSVLLAAAGLGLGAAIAVGLALLYDARWSGPRLAAKAVVYVGRGVPLILLLLLVHQLSGTGATPVQSAVVTLALYSAAYQAGIIHAGLRSVPPQLVDDARVLGYSPARALVAVRLPYALRVMQPALTGQAITVFKDSSVVVVLGVADLTTTARVVLGADVENAPHWVATYLAVGLLYLAVAVGVARLAARAERRVQRSGLLDTLAAVG